MSKAESVMNIKGKEASIQDQNIFKNRNENNDDTSQSSDESL